MSHLNDLLIKELSDLKVSAEYWDVRIEDTFETNLHLVDGEIVTCSSSPSVGAFLRVRKDGFWFYESTTDMSQIRSTLEKLSSQKVKSSKPGTSFQSQGQPPYINLNSQDRKFSAVPLDRKLNLIQTYDLSLASHKKVVSRSLRYKDVYKVKSYLNSSGTQFEYDFNQSGFVFV